ncbi:MAG: AMP phosphorylase [Candidatus Woesearchaeota archaeon]
MKLRVKDIAVCTGSISIAILNFSDAHKMDLHYADRIRIRSKRKDVIASVDITTASDFVLPGEIGLFEEVYRKLNVKDNDVVEVHIEKKPKSLGFIKEKLQGKVLNYEQMRSITDDLISDKLTDIEIAYFVSACFTQELTNDEIVYLTKAMVDTGKKLELKEKIVVDKHCIGGVAANRTTMIVVPIVVAAGLIIPKTSSRAITSAAGTADTVEVLCDVSFSLEKMKKIVKQVGGCLVWGGAVDLAPADDKIIRVEQPLSLDPTGQLVASIMSKKKAVGATHVLIDIPIGKGTKAGNMKKALELKRKFIYVSKAIGIKVKVVITDGSQPIGNGVGPVLEARDVLWTLQNSKNAAQDLKAKSIELAGHMIELAGKAKKGEGRKIARQILEKGLAYIKFVEILRAQGAKVIYPEQIELAAFRYDICASKSGRVLHVDNSGINKVARIAGAPVDPKAGLYLYVHKGYNVKKGEKLLTIYADSKERLEFAKNAFKTLEPIEIK